MSTRRFPLPWTMKDNGDAYYVEDAAGNRFGFTFYRDKPIIGTDNSVRLERDEARRLVTNIAKLPELLRG